ncbi:glycoside hydrolase family 130 protein [Caldanaerobius polysaccharolyticus]|nr:glycosidase [Caldanaerobius polysaccharolyticus]
MNSYIDPSSLFRRYHNNPILTRQKWPYPVNAVFNPGAVEINGETLLMVRVEDMRGYSHFTLARSRDGKTDWRIDEKPTLEANYQSNEEHYGVEDPRIVWLENLGVYAITYVSFSKTGPLVSLATTRDFITFKRYGALLPPEDKDASLFPKLIKGRFALIHRPIVRGEAHIWISFSPDLKYWGEHQMIIPSRTGSWDSTRVGLGPPPIETPEGWLIIYHGVRNTAAGNLYRVGLALLDLEDPRRVIRRSEEWVFGPRTSYEYIGDVPGVVFPTGAIVDKNTGEMRIYYGAADSVVALATANIKEVLEYLKSCPGQKES